MCFSVVVNGYTRRRWKIQNHFTDKLKISTTKIFPEYVLAKDITVTESYGEEAFNWKSDVAKPNLQRWNVPQSDVRRQFERFHFKTTSVCCPLARQCTLISITKSGSNDSITKNSLNNFLFLFKLKMSSDKISKWQCVLGQFNQRYIQLRSYRENWCWGNVLRIKWVNDYDKLS